MVDGVQFVSIRVPKGGCRVSTVIVVANQTLGTRALERTIEQLEPQETTVHFLVPVKDIPDLAAAGSLRAGSGPAGDIDATCRMVAEQRLTLEQDWARGAGFTTTGELVSEREAADAVQRLVPAIGADQVIVSTLPTALSRWLRQDLPHRIERKVSIPVTVVTPNGG